MAVGRYRSNARSDPSASRQLERIRMEAQEGEKANSAATASLGERVDTLETDADALATSMAVSLKLPSYLKTALPAASPAGQMIYVTNDVGGATPAFSDGSAWRRVADRAIIA